MEFILYLITEKIIQGNYFSEGEKNVKYYNSEKL